MKRTIVCLIAGVFLAAAVGCASLEQGTNRQDFELFVEGQELENVTIDPEIGSEVDMSADRNRVGARFAFGRESVRGFFQIFREDWEFTDLPSGQPGAEYDNWGIGGGVAGAPVVGKRDGSVTMFIPYRADLSFVGGENADDSEWEMLYVDLHLEGGFGIDWKGLRPSVGLAVHGMAGELSGYGLDNPFVAANGGVFLDVSYKHPEFPLYGHIRAMGGDYRSLTIGIGVKF